MGLPNTQTSWLWQHRIYGDLLGVTKTSMTKELYDSLEPQAKALFDALVMMYKEQ